jgi:predicted ATPase/DNA-binding winged helix-turn-helix (wHTH) protein
VLTQRRIYEFDDFRVDTGQFLLTRSGQSKPITPTVFRILHMLLDRAGEVVSKDELIRTVWPDSYVEEGNLNRNVSTLRKALGERPSDHKYIETIPKSGYRFVAPVRTVLFQTQAVPVHKSGDGALHDIVARDSERQQLRNAFDRACNGRGSIICINGDAGTGKTALVDAFIRDLTRNNHSYHVARSRCSESLTECEPFVPWIEAVSNLAQDFTVRDILQVAAPNWYREIAHTGTGAPRKMKRELVDFCIQVAAIQPLIVVVDDFHWSDTGSADLLAFLAQRIESARMLIIVSYRLVDMKIKKHSFLKVRGDLMSRGACTEMGLPLLEPEHIEGVMALQQPNATFADGQAKLLHTRTDGNPLFLREILRAADGQSETIQNLFKARLAQLQDEHRQILIAASVQGREFDSAVLAASLRMNFMAVEDALRDLHEVHELIRPIREEQLPDGKFTVRYRFLYNFCQEVCYASLSPTRKASLNASLAEALLTYYGN